MSDNLSKKLGELIKYKRKDCRYSTQELADKLGVSAGLINNIEHAKTDTFNLKLLNDLSTTLDIDLFLMLSKETTNQNNFLNNIDTTELILNKYNDFFVKLSSLINNNSPSINIINLLDKLLVEIKYFDVLVKPTDS